MTTLIDIDLEAGDLSEFTYTETDSGDLSADAGAALHGNYGLQALIDGTGRLVGQVVVTQAAAGFRFRFYFDPNSITMANNDLFGILGIRQYSGGSLAALVLVYLKYTTATGYALLIECKNDVPANAFSDTELITDAPHCIEIKAVSATNSTSNDGAYEWWIDGTSKGSAASIDNYNAFQDYNWGMRAETTDLDAGTSGTIYWDDFMMTDTPTTEIGMITAVTTKPNVRPFGINKGIGKRVTTV